MKRSTTTTSTEILPIYPEELSQLKNISPDKDIKKESCATRTFFFSGDEEMILTPKMRVEAIPNSQGRAMWRVEVQAPSELSTHLPGLTVGTIRPRSKEAAQVARSSFGLADYRPEGRGLSFLPTTEKPALQQLSHGSARQFGGVFPPDDRQVLTDTSWPWLLTGKVITSDGTTGSGALVGDRVMLTAKHMRPTASIAKGSWWIKFVPHFYDGDEPFGSSYVSDTRYYPSNEVYQDYMVCRLFDPLGTKLGYFGSHEYSDAWNGAALWASVGYPSNFSSAQRPAVQTFSIIEGRGTSGGGQALETEADLWFGASGGPFWAWFTINGATTARIVGVVHGEFDVTPKDDDNSLSGGADMVHLIDWARTNWP
jgi:V8-like Glu-specific endopeptidase